MVFSSLFFLYMFLPICLVMYFATKNISYRNFILTAFSLVFYAWGEPTWVFLLVFSASIDYLNGIIIDKYRNTFKAKLAVIGSLVTNLGLLGFFKYSGFIVENINTAFSLNLHVPEIALPIGISFYTFQTISYTIDCYWGKVETQKNFGKFLLYVSMFPQLVAGPIVRYSVIGQEISQRQTTAKDLSDGFSRLTVGLAKKVIIANNLSVIVEAFFGKNIENLSVVGTWYAVIIYAMQVYFDFSGYSDMAIGLGTIFGFTFPENFNYPYIAASITEFWRRWHMSLSSWFRDYVYIPLGGSRVKKPRALLNIATVWMLTGLWHGADWNFVMWGIMFAALLIAEKTLLLGFIKKHRAIGHIYTLFFVMLCFIMFDASGVKEGFETIAALFGANAADNTEALYYLRSYAVPLIIAAIGATPLPKRIKARLEATRIGGAIMAIAEPVALAALLCLCTAYLIDGSFNPFLYFRF